MYNSKQIIFEAKRTPSILKGHDNEPVFPTSSHNFKFTSHLNSFVLEAFKFQICTFVNSYSSYTIMFCHIVAV